MIDVRNRIVRSLRKRLLGAENKRFRDKMHDPRIVHLRDESAFLLGIINVMVTEGVLLAHPAAFSTWYMLWLPTLMMIRAFSYARKGWQVFMLDFCYTANVLTAAALVLPASWLFWMAFVVANGPVATAILAWRNSLVFHDIDKTTTVVVHAFPALATFCVRWLGASAGGQFFCDPGFGLRLDWLRNVWPQSVWEAAADASSDSCEQPPSYMWLWFLGVAFYVLWQAMYLVVTEVDWLLGGWLERNPDKQTSMRWLVRAKDGAMHRGSRIVCEALGCLRKDEELTATQTKTKAIFVCSQLVFTAVTLIPGVLSALWFEFHALWLLLLLVGAAANGARYYVEVFARKYVQDVEKKWSETVEKAAQLAAEAATSGPGGEHDESRGAAAGKEHAPSRD